MALNSVSRLLKTRWFNVISVLDFVIIIWFDCRSNKFEPYTLLLQVHLTIIAFLSGRIIIYYQ